MTSLNPRMIGRCTRSFTFVATALLVVLPLSALAQSAENKAAARTLGIEGIKLANAGNCEEAVERLARAEALYPAPTIVASLGECQVMLGRIVEGTETLNRVVREVLPVDAPEAFIKARDRAQKLLDESLPKIALLRISVEPAVPGMRITVGDAPVPLALLEVDRPTDPGTHVVRVEAPGYVPDVEELTLAEGGQQVVNLTLAIAEQAKPAPQAPLAAETQLATELRPADAGIDSRHRHLAYALWGVGGAGVITGAVAGLYAMNKRSDLDNTCASRSACPPSAQSTIDSAGTWALVSTIGFGVGLAGAAAGTVLLLTGRDASAAGPRQAAPATTARLYLSPTGVGLAGRF